MNIGEIIAALKGKSKDMPVFFRKVPPTIGNIQAVREVTESTYSFFGKRLPCIILEAEEKE